MSDLRFKVQEKNKLWVKWSEIGKIGNGKVDLKNVQFYGPVTQDYLPLEEKGEIKLDFTNHFLFIVPSYYIVEMSWEAVKSQEQGSIKFDKVTLHDENVGLLNKIKDNDLLLIDCGGHTEEERQSGNYRMVYDCMLYKEGKDPYDFSK